MERSTTTQSAIRPAPIGNNRRIRILIADDHPVVLRGLTSICHDRDDIEVVASCSDGCAALREIARHLPDLAIVDVNAPVKGGFEIARAARFHPGVKIVLMGGSFSQQEFQLALDIPVSGLILKTYGPAQLLHCITAVASGGVCYPDRLLLGTRPFIASAGVNLTSREVEVVELAAAGMPNKRIARRLDLAEGTVKIHIHRILQKTGLHNRTELASFVYRRVQHSAGLVNTVGPSTDAQVLRNGYEPPPLPFDSV